MVRLEAVGHSGAIFPTFSVVSSACLSALTVVWHCGVAIVGIRRCMAALPQLVTLLRSSGEPLPYESVVVPLCPVCGQALVALLNSSGEPLPFG